MKPHPSPQDLLPDFPSSGLPPTFELEYGTKAAESARRYCIDKSILEIRELANEIRTTLTSLNGAASRLSPHHDFGLRQSVSSLNHLTIHLNEFTAPRRKVVYSMESMRQLITEACESALSLPVGDKAGNIDLRCIGDDFLISTSRYHILKALVCLIRCMSSERTRSLRSLNICIQQSEEMAIIEFRSGNSKILEPCELQHLLVKCGNRSKLKMMDLSIVDGYIANLNGKVLFAAQRGKILKALVAIPVNTKSFRRADSRSTVPT